MSEPTKIIDTVDGWPVHTQLWEVGGRHWLICCIDIVTVRNAVAEQWGLDLDPAPGLKGHCEIYEARLTQTPVYQWVPDDPTAEIPEGEPTTEVSEDGETLTLLVDGTPVTTAHREVERVDLLVAAIDADGDPLNGLTPRWVLPHGTTFEQALQHIDSQV